MTSDLLSFSLSNDTILSFNVIVQIYTFKLRNVRTPQRFPSTHRSSRIRTPIFTPARIPSMENLLEFKRRSKRMLGMISTSVIFPSDLQLQKLLEADRF
jgi:hypothetical protein